MIGIGEMDSEGPNQQPHFALALSDEELLEEIFSALTRSLSTLAIP
jgi:hypothetical protein